MNAWVSERESNWARVIILSERVSDWVSEWVCEWVTEWVNSCLCCLEWLDLFWGSSLALSLLRACAIFFILDCSLPILLYCIYFVSCCLSIHLLIIFSLSLDVRSLTMLLKLFSIMTYVNYNKYYGLTNMKYYANICKLA